MMMTWKVVMAAVSLSVMVSGCDGSGGRAAPGKQRKAVKPKPRATAISSPNKAVGPLKPPPTLSRGRHYWELKELPRAKLSWGVHSRPNIGKLMLAFRVQKLRAGTQLALEDRVHTTRDSFMDSVELDISDRVGEMPISSVYRKFSRGTPGIDLKLKFGLTVPGFEPLKGEVPPVALTGAVSRYLARVESGPVKFNGEAEHDGKLDTIALLRSHSVQLVAGKGKKISDIDLVTLVRPAGIEASRKCRFSKGPATIEFKNAEVALFNRHTGEKITETVIKNRCKCPTLAFVRRNKGSTQVSHKRIEAWTRKALVKYRARSKS